MSQAAARILTLPLTHAIISTTLTISLLISKIWIIVITCTECFLWAVHYFKHVAYIKSLNPDNSRRGLLISPLYEGGNWSTEKLRHLSKAAQLVSGRAQAASQAMWPQSLCSRQCWTGWPLSVGSWRKKWNNVYKALSLWPGAQLLKVSHYLKVYVW